MRPGRTVLGRFGHRVGFGPHNFAAQKPARIFHRKRDSPRHSQQRAVLHRITQVQPKRPVGFEHVPHAVEDFHQRLHVLFQRRFVTDFVFARFVVAQLKIGRRCDHCLNAIGVQLSQFLCCRSANNHPCRFAFGLLEETSLVVEIRKTYNGVLEVPFPPQRNRIISLVTSSLQAQLRFQLNLRFPLKVRLMVPQDLLRRSTAPLSNLGSCHQ